MAGNNQTGKKQKKIQVFELGSVAKTETIMVYYTLTGVELLPRGLKELVVSASVSNTEARLLEEKNSGGKISFEDLATERKGILDSGRNPLKNGRNCQGGLEVVNQLIEKNGWYIVAANFENRVSEQDKAQGNYDNKKIRVGIVLSRTGEEMILSDETFYDIGRLLDITWGYANVWINEHEKSTTINFGLPQTRRPADLKIVL
jgi:hypothetical protein